jgi:hypothetical protein
MSYVGANPKFTTQLYRPQSADPSNPAEGMVFRSDGTSRSKGLWEYREGNWQRFGADEKTYIANYNIDSSTTSWATYADAAGVVPVDGTGGVATTTFTFSSSSPLRGSGSGIITKDAANRQGEGISTNFTIDTADQGKVLQLSFDFTTSASFVAADYRVFLYDVTNSLLIEGNARDLQANAGYGLYIGNFQTSSNSTSYRLILHCATTNATAYTIKVDNFIMSPSQVAQGAIVTDWQAYTPTGSHVTNATYTGFYRRVGDTLEIRARVVYSGATNAGTELNFNLPTGLTIDTAKLNGTNNTDSVLGLAAIQDVSVNDYQGVVSYNSTTSLKVRILIEGAQVAVVNNNYTSAFPFTTAINDRVQIQAWGIPIVGWSSSITVPSQQTNQVIAFKASLTANQAIASASATLVTFNTVSSAINNGYNTAGAFDTTNSRFVAPEAGSYYFAAHLLANSDVSSGAYYSVLFRVNGTSKRAFRWYFNDTVGQWYGSVTFPLVKGDYVDIALIGDASYNVIGGDGSSSAIFEGFKIQGNQTIGMDEFVGATYETNAGLSVLNNTLTTILYEDKIDDSHSAYNTSTGEYTIPVAGRYLINAKMLYDNATAWAVSETAQIRVYVNGVEKSTSTYELPSTPGTNIQVNPTVTFYQANFSRGDIVTIRTNQTSGATQTVRNYAPFNTFSIARIK